MKKSLLEEVERIAEMVERYQDIIREEKKNIDNAIKNYLNVGVLNDQIKRSTNQIGAYLSYLNTAEEKLMMIQNIAIKEDLKDVFKAAQQIKDTIYIVD